VDDEPDIAFTLRYILEIHDFKADIFTDPTLALQYFKINYYDLVILDIKMPKINGLELYAKLREKDPKVKICFLTATAVFTEELKTSMLKLDKNIIDKDFFIQKPIRMEDLIKRITAIMNE
jgi:DNA-binding response OmpR family regulator